MTTFSQFRTLRWLKKFFKRKFAIVTLFVSTTL